MSLQANKAIGEVIETQEERFTSKAWKHFKPVKVGGVRFSVCKYYGTRIKSTRNCGTSSMLDHICRCRKKPSNLEIKDGSGGDNGSQPRYFDQDVSRRELTHAIILHVYPLSIVDHVRFWKFVASLQPLFKMVSRNTIKNDILKIFDNLKSKTSKLLEKLTSRIAIATDIWTSDNNKKGFMAITTHFIDDSWRFQSHILRFVYIPAPRDKDTLCSALLNF